MNQSAHVLVENFHLVSVESFSQLLGDGGDILVKIEIAEK
jgi:hypothetical protein